ncbi:MAG: phosphatase PAP2 family protein [candidate division Zixibacteria bacterium]|nr:phosphatase PAP2 family protein [candidate division Zixibacteria bacterium]MCI0595556.1 phosphatase PAP2 family protein [candidate division Zixibacteria bacterium]
MLKPPGSVPVTEKENQKTPARKRFYLLPIDQALFGYLGFLSVSILLFHSRLPNWGWFLVFHGAVAGVVLFLAAALKDSTAGLKGLLRWGYLILLFTFLYEETGYLVHLFFDRWFDPQLIDLEYKLTAAIPSVWMAERANVWLTEILMAGYFSYYVIIPLGALILWGKQKTEDFQQLMLSVSIGFFISYAFFLFYPVEGPRYHIPHLHPPAVDGPLFYHLVKFAIDKGAIHGGCMPSSHVAVAVLILMSLYRGARTWFWIMLPFVAGLATGTVYGRFHYVSDVIVGLAIAPVAFGLANRWLLRFNSRTNVS